MEVVKDNVPTKVGGKEIRSADARKFLRKLRTKKDACNSKMYKSATRVKLLERFINDTRGNKITLRVWMKSKGLNYSDFFRSMGYYTPLQLVVSDDVENNVLIFNRGMVYHPEVGYHLPQRKVVTSTAHNTVTKSKLGMTYDPALSLYFPTTVYDTDAFSSAEGSGDMAMDIMGGFTTDDIGNLSAYNQDAEDLTTMVKELYEEEFDNVDTELEAVEILEHKAITGEDYSGAEGDTRAGRNATCRAGCGLKHPFSRNKRESCQEDCDKRFPPSEKQEGRRDDREDRQEARVDKRAGKKDCKQKYQAGEIDVHEYRRCKSAERFKKRESVRDAGGSFIARAWSGMAKVNPITALSRGGAIMLVKWNAFGFSTRLAPALLPREEALSKFKESAIPKAEKGWAKVIRAWKSIGGNPEKLKESILTAYNKKPMKISRKERKKKSSSSFSGNDQRYNNYQYRYEETSSNITGAEVAPYVISGLGVVVGLISALNKGGADKNPYPSNQTPSSYAGALNDGTLNTPQPDPNSPEYDPTTEKWIDPSTGRNIDPQTGEFTDDKILGMNKWLALGIGLAVIVGGVMLFTRKKGTGN